MPACMMCCFICTLVCIGVFAAFRSSTLVLITCQDVYAHPECCIMCLLFACKFYVKHFFSMKNHLCFFENLEAF